MNFSDDNALLSKLKDFDGPLHGSPLFLAAICLVASTGGFLFGFDTAVISGTFGFVEKQFALTKLELGWFGSSALGGCILGACVAGWFGDRFGRKPALLAAGFLFFISALFSMIPKTFEILIYARVIGGIGVGIASVLAPMYISEFAPPRIRGRLVALYQLSIVVGILTAYFCNSQLLRFFGAGGGGRFEDGGLLNWVLEAEVWRGMFGSEMIPALSFILMLLVVPESPRWLVERNKPGVAFRVMSRIGGSDQARQEIIQISDSLKHEEGTLRELFKPGLRLALIVGLGLSIFGQMTGVNIVVYYGPSILEQSGIKLGSAMQYQVMLGVINLVFTLIAIWKVDTWGRRPLLIWGMGIVTLTLGITGILFLLKVTSGFLIVLVLGIYMACVALSICSVIWVITPEIFPNRIRGRAMSIAVFSNWGTNTLSAFMFPWFVAKFGLHTAFFMFGIICFAATLFFWKFVPETKGRSLEEIEKFWTVEPKAPSGKAGQREA